MSTEPAPLQTLEDIKQLMHRGSRFISLSGWSGVAAGLCALVAAWGASKRVNIDTISVQDTTTLPNFTDIHNEWLQLAATTFITAFILAFLFTYIRSKKTRVPIGGLMARKVMWSVAVPMVVGGLFIVRLADLKMFSLLVPSALLFYGLGLINASKFTVSEIRYLGYLQLFLGIINLWNPTYGLYCWSAGFGVLHIVYGIVVWNKYERNENIVA